MSTTLLLNWEEVGPIDAKSVPEQVAQEIRSKIALGVWPPGHQLPPERLLARRMGVGRQTVRDALRILSEEGRVTPGGDRTAASVTPAVQARRLSDLPDERKIQLLQSVHFRIVLEREAAALAAEARTNEHLGRMTKAQGDLRTALVLRERDMFRTADAAFHLAVAAASGSEVLFNAILRTRSDLFPVFDRVIAESDTLADSFSEHERVLNAVMEQDAGAAMDRMSEHLEHTRSRVEDELRARLKAGRLLPLDTPKDEHDEMAS